MHDLKDNEHFHTGKARKARNPRERWEARDTRKTAIDAFCYQCMGDLREEIRRCPSGPGTINPCPLWHWRPYQ